MLGRSSVQKLQCALTHRSTHTYGCSKLTLLKSSCRQRHFRRTQTPSGRSHMPFLFFLGRCNDPFAPDEHNCVSESKNLCLREEEEEELLFLKREPRLHFGNCCRRQVALHAILPTKKKEISRRRRKKDERWKRSGEFIVVGLET